MTPDDSPIKPAPGSLRFWLTGLGLLAVVALLAFGASTSTASLAALNKPMPEFRNQSPSHWINSKPLKRAELKGKVVLIEIWTSV
ncbi:MAG: hypothetical protein V3S64_03435 [bacterium]